MSDQTIKCLKCGAEIQLTEALTGQIEQSIKLKYEAETVAKDKEIQAKLKEIKQQAKALEEKQQTIDEQIAEQVKAERKKIAEEKKALDTQRREIEDNVAEQVKAERKKIADEKKALEVKRQQIEDEVADREKELRITLTKQLKTKLAEEQAEKTKTLEQELEEKRKEVAEANQRELGLRKQQQKLEEEKAAIKLTVQRQLDEERKKIFEDAGQKAAEEQQLKMREKDDQLDAMKKQIDELKRKAEVGSQERQGEALEGALCDALQQAFPSDKFEEVKKGQRGADILQIVRNSTGKECGEILWESKNTKDFSNKWIEKIRADQQEANADVAVIVSVVLPKEVKGFDQIEDVWVSDYACSVPLATALRQMLINVIRERLIGSNQNSMRDILYRYVTGQEFALNVKAIINAFKRMHEDLEQEKRAMQKIWKSREKQISTVLENVSGICGSIDGLVGQQVLPPIEPLMLESATNEENIENEGKGNTAKDDIPF